MNIFKTMVEKFRKPVPPPKAKPYIFKEKVHVRKDFVLPMGEHVVTPFNLIIEAGVRWHPEWTEPRVTVNAWRLLPLGDALSFSGDQALVFATLLNPHVVALAQFHGQHITPVSQKLLDRMGLAAPTERQERATFNSWRHN